jgi:hypothetical protein
MAAESSFNPVLGGGPTDKPRTPATELLLFFSFAAASSRTSLQPPPGLRRSLLPSMPLVTEGRHGEGWQEAAVVAPLFPVPDGDEVPHAQHARVSEPPPLVTCPKARALTWAPEDDTRIPSVKWTWEARGGGGCTSARSSAQEGPPPAPPPPPRPPVPARRSAVEPLVGAPPGPGPRRRAPLPHCVRHRRGQRARWVLPPVLVLVPRRHRGGRRIHRGAHAAPMELPTALGHAPRRALRVLRLRRRRRGHTLGIRRRVLRPHRRPR